MRTRPRRSINIDDPTTANELCKRDLLFGLSQTEHSGERILLHRKTHTAISKCAADTCITAIKGPPRSIWPSTGWRAPTPAEPPTLPSPSRFPRAAHVVEPNNVIDQGFTYKVNEWWSALLDYRYSRFTMDSTADYRSVNAAAVATGVSLEQWMVGTSTLDSTWLSRPTASLLIRAGVRLFKEDVEQFEDGVRTLHHQAH